MEVNMLNYIIRKVLFMKYKDEMQRPIDFLSKSLNKIKRNYKIHNKEMLLVVKELENWRYLLKDTKFKFKVWMDYKNLEYFIKVQKLNKRQAYQVPYLSLGANIRKTDRLSRRLDQKVETENDNNNQTLIKDYQIHNLVEVVIERPEIDIREKIKRLEVRIKRQLE